MKINFREITTTQRNAEIAQVRHAMAIKIADRNILDEHKYLRARDDFYLFLKEFWDVIEPSMPLIDGPHLKVICDALAAVGRGEITRLIVNIPPGHAKSNIVSVAFPAWMWLRNPAWRSLFGTYEYKLAERDSVRTRDVITSEKYQRWLSYNPQKWELRSDSNRKDLFTNTASGFRMSTSVGGRGTGWRVDAVIADDPLNSIDARSEAARDGCVYWFTKAISSRLKDPRTGALIIIMQRLHADDLTGYLLRQGGYEHLCLPSQYDPKRHSVVRNLKGDIVCQDWRKESGELLFPALYTEEVLAQALRTMGSDGFAGQHQQRPAPPEGGMFKKLYWRFFKPDGVASDAGNRPDLCYAGPARALPTLDQTIISLDATFKDGAKNDYVCFAVIGVHKADRYILKVVRKKLSFTATIEMFRQLAKEFPKALRKLVEDKANGSAIIDTLKSEISGIIAIEPEGGKESRAAAIQPQVESGNVYVLDGAYWLDDFVQEFADFPNGSHDDQVDAVSQALIYLSASPAASRALAMGKV